MYVYTYFHDIYTYKYIFFSNYLYCAKIAEPKNVGLREAIVILNEEQPLYVQILHT